VISITATTSNPPVAKKVIVGALGYGLATVLQLVIPGYHPDPLVAQLIDAALGTAAAFVVREETKYLVPALEKAKQYENGVK
jgi:hypothetical protein